MTAATARGRTPAALLRAVGRRVSRTSEQSRLGTAVPVVGPSGGRHVVLTGPSSTTRARRWLADSKAAEVLVLTNGATERLRADDSVTVREAGQIGALVKEVKKFGRIDALIVLVPRSELPNGVSDHYDLFSRLFLYLAPGGAFVVDSAAHRDTRSRGLGRRWRRLLDAAKRSGADKRQAAAADAVGTLIAADDLVVVTKQGHHYLKLRAKDAEDVLPAREPAVKATVLHSQPAGSFEPRAVETAYGPRADSLPTSISYPAMALRHYTGDMTSAGGMRLFTGNTILPESFRWYFASEGGEARLGSVSREFALLQPRLKAGPKRSLPGDYYYLDCVFDGHFGHLTTEVVSRLWGWEHAKRDNPDLKALFHVRRKRNNDPRLERALFTAFGISEADLVWVQGPVRINSLVSATPMWQDQHPHFAHPDITMVWEKLTAGLLRDAEPSRHERIFVSRGSGLAHRRPCHNQEEVERFFADRGFHVFCPEDLPLSEQVALFAGARVVAGFAGSAMFNLMHTKRLEATIVLGHNSYLARNEHLFAAVLGGDLHYFWAPADVPPPTKGRSKESVRSSWRFDFTEHGSDLEHVLAAY
jgi:hypothetical protein